MQSGTKITSLNHDAELVNKAQVFGLNLSKWVNSKLKEFFYGSFTSSNTSMHYTYYFIGDSNIWLLRGRWRNWSQEDRVDNWSQLLIY